jgi:hypothetical protein
VRAVALCALREPASRANSKPNAFALSAIVTGHWRAPETFRTAGECHRVLARAEDFLQSRCGRGVRYSGTIINAHHVSQACVQTPCAHHMSPRAGQIANRTPSRCQRLSKGVGARRRLFARPAWPRRTFALARISTRDRTAGRAPAWAPRLNTRNAQRSNGQSMCDAQRAVPRATEKAPRSSIFDA